MFELLRDIAANPFLWRSLIGALLVAVMAAPLGCLMVWQRMVYFGDALAHTALLGAALALLWRLPLSLSVSLTCALAALLLFVLQNAGGAQLGKNTLLGVIAHGALAAALVVLAWQTDIRFDLYAFLFGDVLAMGMQDLFWIAATALLGLVLLLILWRPLLSLIVHDELAVIEGVAVKRTRVLFLLLMALVVAVAMKIVGVILIVALLIIPAAAARRFARTPEQMVLLALILAALSTVLGLLASLRWDVPAGPAMVLVMTGLFLLLQFAPRWVR